MLVSAFIKNIMESSSTEIKSQKSDISNQDTPANPKKP